MDELPDTSKNVASDNNSNTSTCDEATTNEQIKKRETNRTERKDELYKTAPNP